MAPWAESTGRASKKCNSVMLSWGRSEATLYDIMYIIWCRIDCKWIYIACKCGVLCIFCTSHMISLSRVYISFTPIYIIIPVLILVFHLENNKQYLKVFSESLIVCRTSLHLKIVLSIM